MNYTYLYYKSDNLSICHIYYTGLLYLTVSLLYLLVTRLAKVVVLRFIKAIMVILIILASFENCFRLYPYFILTTSKHLSFFFHSYNISYSVFMKTKLWAVPIILHQSLVHISDIKLLSMKSTQWECFSRKHLFFNLTSTHWWD